MADVLAHLGGVPVLLCGADGPLVRGEVDAVELIAAGYGTGAEWVVLPVSRLDEAFFRLRTRVAGEIVGKLATYSQRLIVVGDVSAYEAESRAFADFVWEANRGRQLWFVGDVEEAGRRLAETLRAA